MVAGAWASGRKALRLADAALMVSQRRLVDIIQIVKDPKRRKRLI